MLHRAPTAVALRVLGAAVLGATVLGAGVLGADEPRPLEARMRTVAAPTAERDFAVDLAIVALDTVVGRARLEAAAATDADGRRGWRVRETLQVGEGDDAGRTVIDARLDRSLDPLRGRWTEGVGEDPLVHAFVREDDVVKVTVTGDGRDPTVRDARRPGPALLGLASLVLLAREIAHEEGVYTARVFHPDWEVLLAERPYADVRIETGPATWRERDVHRLDLGADGDDRRIRVVLDPATRDVLYVHYKPPDAPAFDLRPLADVEPPEEDALLDVPARTPRAAAMRTTLAFLTADATLFEAVVHWPRLQELGKSYVRGEVTPEAFKQAVLEQFRKNVPPPMPPDAARRRILEAKDDFRVERQGDDRARVHLPASIAPMRLTVERVDEQWYLVRLPEAG